MPSNTTARTLPLYENASVLLGSGHGSHYVERPHQMTRALTFYMSATAPPGSALLHICHTMSKLLSNMTTGTCSLDVNAPVSLGSAQCSHYDTDAQQYNSKNTPTL